MDEKDLEKIHGENNTAILFQANECVSVLVGESNASKS